MTNRSESGPAADDSQELIQPPTPKRGAFPTPKSEIDKAKPYVPDIGKGDDPEKMPDPPADVDDQRDD